MKASSTAPSSRTVVPAMSRQASAKWADHGHPRLTPAATEGVGGDGRGARHAPPARPGDHPHAGADLVSVAQLVDGVDALGVDAFPAPGHRGQGVRRECGRSGPGVRRTAPRRARSRTAPDRHGCRRSSTRRPAVAPRAAGGDARPPPGSAPPTGRAERRRRPGSTARCRRRPTTSSSVGRTVPSPSSGGEPGSAAPPGGRSRADGRTRLRWPPPRGHPPSGFRRRRPGPAPRCPRPGDRGGRRRPPWPGDSCAARRGPTWVRPRRRRRSGDHR